MSGQQTPEDSMARLRLEIPENLPFATEIVLRVGDMNYGNHLGNDALLGLLHEARLQFLASLGYSELDLGGAASIMADVAIVYKAQAFRGDRLRIAVGTGDFTGSGFDVLYRVTKVDDGTLVALAKTAMVLFDYQRGRPLRMDDGLRARLGGSAVAAPGTAGA
jgi:acyl-CoA thioester hydrolase